MHHDRDLARPFVDQAASRSICSRPLTSTCQARRRTCVHARRRNEDRDFVGAHRELDARFVPGARPGRSRNRSRPLTIRTRRPRRAVRSSRTSSKRASTSHEARRIVQLGDQELLSGFRQRPAYDGNGAGDRNRRVVLQIGKFFHRRPRRCAVNSRLELGQRMARDEDAERFALPRQHLARRRRGDVGELRRKHGRIGDAGSPKSETCPVPRRASSAPPARGPYRAPRASARDCLAESRRAALDQRLQDATVDVLRVDARGQVKEIAEPAVAIRAPR